MLLLSPYILNKNDKMNFPGIVDKLKEVGKGICLGFLKKIRGKNYKVYKALNWAGIPLNDQTYDEIFSRALLAWEESGAKISELVDLLSSGDSRTAFRAELTETADGQFIQQLQMLININDKYEILRAPEFKIEEEAQAFSQAFIYALQESRTPQDAEHIKITKEIREIVKPRPITQIPKFNKGLEKEPHYIERTYTALEDIAHRNSFFREYRKDNLLNIIQQTRHVVIIGNAGTGKSVDLENLAITVGSSSKPLIAIYRKLKYINGKSMKDFLPEGWELVQKEQLLLVLDSLDEIPPAYAEAAILEIQDFAETNKEITIVVSCRATHYILPINKLDGTLKGFSVYTINDLELSDVKNYAANVYHVDPDKFIADTNTHRFLDLVVKPYFLRELLIIYKPEEKYPPSRMATFNQILENIFIRDQNHYGNLPVYKYNKDYLKSLMIKIALCMEMLGKNTITQEELFKILKKREDKELFHYFPAFNAEVRDDEEYYQFVHNNIQELLAANYLTSLSFEDLLKLITIGPTVPRINRSWINTLSFLFSILENGNPLLVQLTEWMYDNNQSILLIEFEREKVPEELREKIFNDIYNGYKEKNITIHSQLNCKALASFGESKETVDLVIDDITRETSIENLSSALTVAKYFTNLSAYQCQKIKDLLLNIINKSTQEIVIEDAIDSLTELGFASLDITSVLVAKFGDERRNSIRSAIYHLLIYTEKAEDFVSYFTNGWYLNLTGELQPTHTMHLVGSDLLKGLTEHKKINSTRQVIEFVKAHPNVCRSSNFEDVLKEMVTNCVRLNNEGQNAYTIMIDFIKFLADQHMEDEAKEVISFFQRTGNNQKACEDLLTEDILGDYPHRKLLLWLGSDVGFHDLIMLRYKEGKLSQQALLNYYHTLRLSPEQSKAEIFAERLRNEAQIIIEKNEEIDYKALRQKELKKAFSALFTPSEIETEVERLFKIAGKNTITVYDIVRISAFIYQPVPGVTPINDVALNLARRCLEPNLGLSHSAVIDFMKNESAFEYFRVDSMKSYLERNELPEPTGEQITWIAEWCLNAIREIDFYTSVTTSNFGISYNWKAACVSYFTKRLKFNLPEKTMLDMLAFDFRGAVSTDFTLIIEKVGLKKVTERVIENLQYQRLTQPSAIIQHANFIIEYNVESGYSLIEEIIFSETADTDTRKSVLKLYLSYIKDLPSFENICNRNLPFDFQYVTCIEMLKKIPGNNFVKPYLENLLVTEPALENKLTIAGELIELQSLRGLQFLRDNLTLHQKDLSPYHFDKIKKYASAEGIDTLFDLYYNLLPALGKQQSTRENHDLLYLENCIHNSLFQIAFQSEANFQYIKNKYLSLINTMESKFSKVKNLHYLIVNLDEQYYERLSGKITLDKVLLKIDALEK